MTDWLTNINPIFEDYDDKDAFPDRASDFGQPLPRNFESSWNYCEYGHYEEGNSPNHPCVNEAFAHKVLDCE